MSSNYLDEEEGELLYMKWIPKLCNCNYEKTKICILVLAYSILVLYAGDNIFMMTMGIYHEFPIFYHSRNIFPEFDTLAQSVAALILIIGIHKEKKAYVFIWLLINEVLVLEISLFVLFNLPFLIQFGLEEILITLAIAGIKFLAALVFYNFYLIMPENTVVPRATHQQTMMMDSYA